MEQQRARTGLALVLTLACLLGGSAFRVTPSFADPGRGAVLAQAQTAPAFHADAGIGGAFYPIALGEGVNQGGQRVRRPCTPRRNPIAAAPTAPVVPPDLVPGAVEEQPLVLASAPPLEPDLIPAAIGDLPPPGGPPLPPTVPGLPPTVVPPGPPPPVIPPPPPTTPIPEPGAWALMITGFGLLGWALRRRRVAAVA